MTGLHHAPLHHAPANLLPFDGDVRYYPDWFAEDADELFEALVDGLMWAQAHARFFGKPVPLPRLTAWYGPVEYRYSGVRHPARPFVPVLSRIAAAIEPIAPGMDCVLGNRYRTGADSVGWHTDGEELWGPRPTIASVSFGASRRFVLKHRSSKRIVDIELSHGSVLVLSGTTQSHWLHALPRTAKPVGERVNLTYRRLASATEGTGRSCP